jgi:hypothetical protein
MDIRTARREFKFRLDGERAQLVLAEIRERLPGDVNGAAGAYPIVSEYYDTDERDAYWERDRKVANRRKLRVRIYGTLTGTIPPSAFLEVKHKCDGVGVKRRLSLPVEVVTAPEFDVGEWIREEMPRMPGRIERTLAREILLLLENRGVKPAIQMRYDRLAFEGPDDVRITFDSGIKARTERRPLKPDDREIDLLVLPEGECIMEVKLFGAAPYWIRDIAARHRLVKTPFSKYCTALEKYDPTIRGIFERRTQKSTHSTRKTPIPV